MIYRNRLHFAAVVRRARRDGTLTSYDRQPNQWRAATIGWRWHLYEPAWSGGVAQTERDEAYERMAARARSNDFAETGGRDWT
jgi:hypothetical protein